MSPNRVVAIATAVIALILGLLPVLGGMDTTSTAGIIAGIAALLGVAYKWLDGWQKHEARLATTAGPDDPAFPVVGDEVQNQIVVP
jgi:uncharacterized membrane protein YebE (DUF533 family)